MRSNVKSGPIRGAVVLAGGLMLLPLLAVADDLPPASQILDHYVEVTGGTKAYEAVTNRVTTGTFSMAAMGLSGKLTVQQAAPGLMHTTVELPGIGTIESGFDGTTAWEINPMTGARILEGTEKAVNARDAVFNAELKYRDLYTKAETTGKEKVGDRDAWTVVLTPAEGNPETRYYDTETGLLLKVVRVVTTQMGEMPMTMTPSDYRTVDGLLLPMKLDQDLSVQSMSLQFDTVQHNVELPADTFALPDAIKALQVPGAPSAPVQIH